MAVFFIALFSQVIGPNTSALAKILYASTALIIDMAWYVLVVWMVTRPAWLAVLQQRAWLLERLFGVILIALAARLVAETLGGRL